MAAIESSNMVLSYTAASTRIVVVSCPRIHHIDKSEVPTISIRVNIDSLESIQTIEKIAANWKSGWLKVSI
jgi:hypothetical protein